MKEIKIILCSIVCLGFTAAPMFADEVVEEPAKKEEKAKKPIPENIDLSLAGTIATEERVNKKKGTTNTVYVLTTAEGNKINLPKPNKKKGADSASVINLDDFLEGQVKVTGKGYIVTNKKGKKFTKVKKVIGVEKISK